MMWLPCDEIALPDPRQGRRVHGYGGVALRGLVASSGGGAPATGPASWGLFDWWDANIGVTVDGSNRITDWQSDGARSFIQIPGSADSSRPAYSQNDVDWNSEDTPDFDGVNDWLEADTAEWSQAAQKFLNDGSTSYRIDILVQPKGGGGSLLPVFDNADVNNTGVLLRHRDDLQEFIFQIWNSGSNVSVKVSAPGAAEYHVAIELDIVAETLRMSVNGGAWSSVSTSAFTFSSSNPTDTFTIGRYSSGGTAHDCKIPWIGFDKKIPSNHADRVTYFADRYGL